MPIVSPTLFFQWRWWLVVASATLALHAAASAKPLSPADEKSIHAVVQEQLAAFAADDATKAFSYAAPNVRRMMRSAERFMAMVRNGYPVVYRPASVAFLKPESQDAQVVQGVQMTDASGDSWLAIYTLEQQTSKAWRITGCTLVTNKGRFA